MSTHLSNTYVKFWGVRGSHPTPGMTTVGYGGNTACVEVSLNGQTIILDAGTGLIALGRELAARSYQAKQPIEATILFSHLHHDHTQGFPFFQPAYIPTARLRFFGPDSFQDNLESVLARNQTPPMFPVTLKEMASAKEICTVQQGDVILLDDKGAALRRGNSALSENTISVRIHHSYAHPGGTLVYRIEGGGVSLVYATDVEGYVGVDRRLANFARGADLLIHDAQYSDEHYRGQLAGFPATQGYGHSTTSMACELAAAAGVKQLVLFHHDPNYDDEAIAAQETHARTLFPNVYAAYEGLEIPLGNNHHPEIARQSFLPHAQPVSLAAARSALA